MSSTKKPSREDIELFRRSIGPVRKLDSDKTPPQKRQPAPGRRASGDRGAHFDAPGLSDWPLDKPVSATDTLYFARPGLQLRLLQRLRRGQLPVGAELDMHGMTRALAQQELIRFISYSRDRHIRCVRIIHGKGYGSRELAPVLKNSLNNWLRQHQDVLAFSSTRPEQGGSGALLVLLRSQR
jgi:DNA-nicking Smr family endonuclease